MHNLLVKCIGFILAGWNIVANVQMINKLSKFLSKVL